MNVVSSVMFVGDIESDAEIHVCPFRPAGVDQKQCLELSGRNAELNKANCCGAVRADLKFGPCNFVYRRCWACLEAGRLGGKANAVTDVDNGTCNEHAHMRLSSLALSFDVGLRVKLSADELRERNRRRVLTEKISVGDHTRPAPLAPPYRPPKPVVHDSAPVFVEEDIPTPEESASLGVPTEEVSKLETNETPAHEPEQIDDAVVVEIPGADPPPSEVEDVPEPKEVPAQEVARPDRDIDVKVDEELIVIALAKVPKLNARHTEMLRLCGLGLANPDIANRLGATVGAVSVAFSHIYSTMGLSRLPVSLKRLTAMEVARRHFASDFEYAARAAALPRQPPAEGSLEEMRACVGALRSALFNTQRSLDSAEQKKGLDLRAGAEELEAIRSELEVLCEEMFKLHARFLPM